MSNLYGSLVIESRTPVQQLPQLEGSAPVHGNHTNSRTLGMFSTVHTGVDVAQVDVAIPQRNKYMQVTVISKDKQSATAIAEEFHKNLGHLDSRFEGSRQLYKLNQLMCEIHTGTQFYATVINNTSEHGTFALLAYPELAIQLVGIFDTVNNSVRLAWSTDQNFVEDIRKTDPTRYIFYRFPVIENRPVFIHTQHICSSWYYWRKAFKATDGILKAFNALECFLFKDPSIDSFER